MNHIEKDYRNTMLRVGAAMLLFVSLFYTLSSASIFVEMIASRLMDEKSAEIVNQIFYQGIYLFSFLFPAGFFYMISNSSRTERVMTEIRLGASFPLMLLAGLAVVLAAAYLNSFLMEFFNYSKYTEEIMTTDLSENYLLLLAFIGTAIVPAFAEEFLFRGVILTNLLPYGKTTAIVASSALFALMHQNAGQLLYTFVAGIVLGFIYVRTRSIWGCVLLHFVNNLMSVIELLLYDRLAGRAAAVAVTYIEASVFALGIISAIILLVLDKKKKKRNFRESGFGVVFEADEDYIEKPLGDGRAARLFFSPTIIVFTCISGGLMLLMILLASAL